MVSVRTERAKRWPWFGISREWIMVLKVNSDLRGFLPRQVLHSGPDHVYTMKHEYLVGGLGPMANLAHFLPVSIMESHK